MKFQRCFQRSWKHWNRTFLWCHLWLFFIVAILQTYIRHVHIIKSSKHIDVYESVNSVLNNLCILAVLQTQKRFRSPFPATYLKFAKCYIAIKNLQFKHYIDYITLPHFINCCRKIIRLKIANGRYAIINSNGNNINNKKSWMNFAIIWVDGGVGSSVTNTNKQQITATKEFVSQYLKHGRDSSSYNI